MTVQDKTRLTDPTHIIEIDSLRRGSERFFGAGFFSSNSVFCGEGRKNAVCVVSKPYGSLKIEKLKNILKKQLTMWKERRILKSRKVKDRQSESQKENDPKREDRMRAADDKKGAMVYGNE